MAACRAPTMPASGTSPATGNPPAARTSRYALGRRSVSRATTTTSGRRWNRATALSSSPDESERMMALRPGRSAHAKRSAGSSARKPDACRASSRPGRERATAADTAMATFIQASFSRPPTRGLRA
ncbi:MAG TPA: hypothetical protein VIJ69_01105 [Actinomycetota bacterium]